MSTITTDLSDRLGIEYPILQAGMGGAATTNQLAIAVTNAGGLGTVSIGESDVGPENARERQRRSIETVEEHARGPYAVNVPVGTPKHTPDHVLETSDAYVETAVRMADDGRADGLAVLITSAGNPTRWHDEIVDAGLLHFQKVASVEHARKAEAAGCDGIIAAGFEMGGHTHPPDDAVHTFVLVPQVADAVDVPVVAAGGVTDGTGLLAALAMGAQGVSMGTRFLTTVESDFPDAYKEHIRDADEHDDEVIGGVFSPANRMIETEGLRSIREKTDELSPEEYVELEHELWNKSMRDGDVEAGLVPAGQGGCYVDEIPAVEDLIREMAEEATDGYRQLSESFS